MAVGNYKVQKLHKPVDWVVEVPGSKSMTNRALLMAALADGTTTLKGVLFSEDSRNFLGSLKSLGFQTKSSQCRDVMGPFPSHPGKFTSEALALPQDF